MLNKNYESNWCRYMHWVDDEHATGHPQSGVFAFNDFTALVFREPRVLVGEFLDLMTDHVWVGLFSDSLLRESSHQMVAGSALLRIDDTNA